MRTTRPAFYLALLASVASAQSAPAADLGGAPRRPVYDEPIPHQPAFSWSGLYIGANVGYGWSDVDWQFAAAPGIGTGHSGNGGLAGGQIGYNIQMRQFVFGAEADLSGAWIDGATSCPDPSFSCGHSFNWIGSVRGRGGITVNGNRTLLYGTAGVAWADVDYTAKDKGTGAVFGTGFSDTHVGFVAGGGIEHMLTPNLSARAEYLFYGFDSVTAPAGALGGGPATLDLNTQTVRFGLNYKF
ncbi:MAG TPA: outer membrane protein [Hyphomicrobiaceae bacterium]|nr:outer membrane protein [Hyphomicrobiaceae bacterium]